MDVNENFFDAWNAWILERVKLKEGRELDRDQEIGLRETLSI